MSEQVATGAVHHRLIDEGLRLRLSIVVVSGEPRDEHDIAVLVGYGASAVNPYLAIEQVRAITQYDPWFLEQLEEIVADIRALERETGGLLDEIIGAVGS